ncbi:sigma-70 family RNA polymerase sigma factor [Arthrobacter sp. NamB2]|uniref:ECF RNA polymerase sigma factor SigK n=1 Tax=Arthrobacter sp. NamB2 TaxID=2576035 RepID=UPI0010CA13C7|nr:ECF RNA polymerase sigma factor SigK [Arthrobacter sp. NamB2]TKV28623.1 sigma-70 family RNA polymerase sigma factor [Arthrobacter sp. NamB2]
MPHALPPTPDSPNRPAHDTTVLAPATDAPVHLSVLLSAVGGRDERAFEELYALTHRRVYGLVRRVLVDAELSVEVTQEVFLALWQSNAALYDPAKGTPMAWLMTLAHRKAVDKVRSEQSRRIRDLAWGVRHHGTEYDQVSEAVLHREEAASVTACLAILTPAQREAIQLAYFTGLTYTDVAQHLAIPIPTAKTRIRDGIRKLGTCLTDQGLG